MGNPIPPSGVNQSSARQPAVPSTPDIASAGDALEQSLASFIQNDFPEYEAYWKKHVVHLRDPGSVALDSSKNPHDCRMAQLHYTTLVHLRRALVACDTLKWASGFLTFDAFADGMQALCSALDCADELVGRSQKYSTQWDPKTAKTVQQDGRKEMKHKKLDCPDIREYRNHLVHGRIPLQATPGQFPKLDRVDRYFDWRTAVGAGDFDSAHNILKDAVRSQVLPSLRNAWKTFFKV